MNDYITRQAAREFLCILCVANDVCTHKGYCNVTTLFDNIPPADVRPVVRGKWKLLEGGKGLCSKCNRVFKEVWDYDTADSFC